MTVRPFVIAAGLAVSPLTAFAHGTHTCTQSYCCSPHGATASTSGSQFADCSYNSGSYSRAVYCPPNSACQADECGVRSSTLEACGYSSLQNAANHGLSFALDCAPEGECGW